MDDIFYDLQGNRFKAVGIEMIRRSYVGNDPAEWPLGGSAEHFDFNGDGTTDVQDAVTFAFREGLVSSGVTGFLVIAAYDNGCMTACAVLDKNGILSDSHIAEFKAAGEMRAFFLSADFKPLAEAVK